MVLKETANDLLYDKLFEEQEEYRRWLLSQSPEVILNNCYEYSIREDLLLALEYLELEENEAKALLEKGVSLIDLYKDYERRETDHMQDMRDTIEYRVGKILRENKER